MGTVTCKPLDFVVTGSPRSGSRYLARVLAAIGYDCDHEAYFNPWRVVLIEERDEAGIRGDCSWIAVPFLEKLPPETAVIHLVRDPLRTINSILGTGQLDWPNDYRSFPASHVWGDPLHWPSDVRQAAQDFWIYWNERIDCTGRVQIRMQVERIHESLADLVHVLEPGRKLSPSDLERVSEVPRNENTRQYLAPITVSSTDLIPRRRELARTYDSY